MNPKVEKRLLEFWQLRPAQGMKMSNRTSVTRGEIHSGTAHALVRRGLAHLKMEEDVMDTITVSGNAVIRGTKRVQKRLCYLTLEGISYFGNLKRQKEKTTL